VAIRDFGMQPKCLPCYADDALVSGVLREAKVPFGQAPGLASLRRASQRHRGAKAGAPHRSVVPDFWSRVALTGDWIH
jgi:hypothetical protein